MLNRMWRFFGSTDLTIRLLVLIAINLIIGTGYCRTLPKVFNELNHQRFQEWILRNGLLSSWWVWLLFLLLFLFSLNTAVCTTDRLADLLKNRGERPFREFALLVSPSIMHLCFLLIICGHAISQFTAETRMTQASPGAIVSLPDGSLTVNDTRCSYHAAPGMTGMPKECAASITLGSPDKGIAREISVMRPIFLNGYSIHLNLAGKAKTEGKPPMLLHARKDPGLLLILLGNALLCILMLWYFPIIIRGRKG